ncbi:MAG: branched-chain amino acid ABC transporter substrate-binding protein [Thermoproteus sp.]
MTKTTIIAVVIVLLVIIAVALYLATQKPSQPAPSTTSSAATSSTTQLTSTATQQTKTITIAALLPLTGSLQFMGTSGQCAIQLAVQDANKMFASKGVQFQVVPYDTACDPTQALQKIQTVYSQGIKFVVGLTCSSELSAVMNFAEQNGIIITSISTSPLLAIPKPYIFRLPPTDNAQARVVAALLHMLGIKRIVIVYRSDAWGQGLSSAIANYSSQLGIQVLGRFGYDPSPSAMPAAEQAAVQQASKALGTPGPDAAFILVTFDQDGAAVAQAAANDPVLSKVRWFGTDSNVYGTAIMQAAGRALANAKFMGAVASPNPQDPRYLQFVQEFKQTCGHAPTGYDPYYYDTAMIVMDAIATTGSTDPAVINSVLEAWGKNGTFVGVTGPVYFDQYHDRIYASYLIVGAEIVNGTPTWVEAGFYNGTTGQITVYPQGQPLFGSS